MLLRGVDDTIPYHTIGGSTVRRRAGSEWVLAVEGIDQPFTHPGFAALRLDLDTLAQFGVNGMV